MPPCPDPQETLQKNECVPTLSATNSTTTVLFGSSLSLIPNAVRVNPCATSVLLIDNFTRSPFFTVIDDGTNSHCFATIENSFIAGVGVGAGVGAGVGSGCGVGCGAGVGVGSSSDSFFFS